MTLPLVILNGWGMPEAILDDFVEELSRHTQVIRPVVSYTHSVEETCHNIHQQLPEEYIVCGWSLGGMLAMQLSLIFPQSVKGLVTLASNLQFVASEQWPTAMEQNTFQTFEASFAAQPEKALKQFSGLTTLGDEQQSNQRKMLKAFLLKEVSLQDKSIEADPINYKNGLSLLSSLSYIDAIKNLKCPGLFLFGENDYLVPADAVEKIKTVLSSYQLNVDCKLIPESGHIVFMPVDRVASSVFPFLESLPLGKIEHD